MNDLIRRVNSIRNVPHSELNYLVKTVAVILCSPRSGSSLVKNELASHPDIASLDGEIEPFLALTENGFGYNSNSDALYSLKRKSDLVDNILDDLTLPSDSRLDRNFLVNKWKNRFLLQFPELFLKSVSHESLVHILHEIFYDNGFVSFQDDYALESLVLSRVFKDEPWRINYYDGKSYSNTSKWFDESLKIEEPPFVVPKQRRRPVTERDVKNKVLLFKTPPDVYRLGMYEELFPNAEIKYIHLTRGYAQSVNGLMDGWLSPVGFFSHNLRRIGVELNIKGYSDCVPFGKWWWKFDLPPNWKEFLTKRLEDVCLNQWFSAHNTIFASRVETLRISFEDFLEAPGRVIGEIEKYLGLDEQKIQKSLPVMMATETPKLKRWNKRRDLLISLGENREVVAMMEMLGYGMNPDTWS